MATVTLTANEIEVIRTIIDRYRQALLFEISNTDSHDLRAYLKERDILVEDILDRFAEALTETAPVDAAI